MRTLLSVLGLAALVALLCGAVIVLGGGLTTDSIIVNGTGPLVMPDCPDSGTSQACPTRKAICDSATGVWFCAAAAACDGGPCWTAL
jgi:hypothetical protein